MGEWKPMNEKNQRPKQDKEQKQNEKQKENKMKNPFESLSDALTEWKQRLDVIERDETAQREEDFADENKADNDNESEAEDADQYAQIPDDVKAVDNEQQALMDCDDDKHGEMRNIVNKEEEEEDNDAQNTKMDEDEEDFLHNNDSESENDKFDPYQQQKQTNANEQDIASEDKKQKVKDLQIKNDTETN